MPANKATPVVIVRITRIIAPITKLPSFIPNTREAISQKMGRTPTPESAAFGTKLATVMNDAQNIGNIRKSYKSRCAIVPKGAEVNPVFTK